MTTQRGPWTRHATSELLRRRFFTVRSDRVTTPGGTDIDYDWIDAPDLVRVAAVRGDTIAVVEQFHYLPDTTLWQLPGGGVDGEQPADAARRELAEEVGIAADIAPVGVVWPMPGLTASRTHLFRAQCSADVERVDVARDASEQDLVARWVPLTEVVDAVLDGRMSCAASAQLVLLTARATGTL